MFKTKIILDTDIGDDIDDAFALALAQSSNRLELVGVTTVFKNTVARAKMVKKLLDVVGDNSVPVHAGESLPIKEPIHYFERDKPDENGSVIPCQYDSSYDVYRPDGTDAVEFIIKKIEEYPNEIVLVPVGPLTNIARAIEKKPDIVKKIKKIVLMGGWFQNPNPEWNILCDPEAADIVFKCHADVYCVGLNVTMQCALDQELLEKLYLNSDERSVLLTLWLKRWFGHFDFKKSVMHDPLAVATLIDDVCVFEDQYVKVDLENRRGSIVSLPRNEEGGSKVKVATSVDPDRFYSLFTEHLL